MIREGCEGLEEKELLNDWLLTLYSNLRETKKEISELEKNMDRTSKLSELQLTRINDWLNQEGVNQGIKEDLEYSRDVVSNIPKEDEKRLDFLKQEKERVTFMINNLEQELRD